MTAAPPRPRSHTAVVRWVESELSAGRLVIGSRLVGERALADQLGVSRPSVREGIRVLEAMGIIRTAVGSGPDSGAVVVAQPSAGIASALRLHVASSQLPVSDLVQTRLLLESWTVREATERADSTELDAAQAVLDAMAEPRLGAEVFLQLDAEFHLRLARAAGNELVATILIALRAAIHEHVLAGCPTGADWPSAAAKLVRQHRKILLAIRAGDADKAVRRTVRHLEGWPSPNTASTVRDKSHLI